MYGTIILRFLFMPVIKVSLAVNLFVDLKYVIVLGGQSRTKPSSYERRASIPTFRSPFQYTGCIALPTNSYTRPFSFCSGYGHFIFLNSVLHFI
ncbi:hypothetical protein K450DRAFT_250467 [Umbelopsis ramanniana AG]|uniref:Uncharacterized protein n=1 Tax=Umbelopsis ramanniana AG TaxID=1314678 RepID=A0AAD5HCB9_UMBRA|nr:uncharacterized protein K450DRAFT_250467 [Umbelopsis ramanniana AG]KAI8577709.1 hypothetical protein K450DRAFT_250467 [Umbelopsis ramanniana AG]